MNLGLNGISVPVFATVNPDVYNARINDMTELADIISSVDVLDQFLDQYQTLVTIDQLYRATCFNELANQAVEALKPSTEVSIFTIGGAIIKALYNVCKWVLGVIGKIWKWFFSFFKRNMKDARKDINEVGNTIPLAQNEVIGFGVSAIEIDRIVAIFQSHVKAADTDPKPNTGMKIDDYKKLYINTFNNKVPAQAKVSYRGELIARINYTTGAKLNALGWTTADKLSQAADKIDQAEEAFAGILKTLKSQSADIKKIVQQCEANGYVKNEFIEAKGPGAINAACLTQIVVADIKNLTRLEDNFGKMVVGIKKAAKKYVNNQ